MDFGAAIKGMFASRPKPKARGPYTEGPHPSEAETNLRVGEQGPSKGYFGSPSTQTKVIDESEYEKMPLQKMIRWGSRVASRISGIK